MQFRVPQFIDIEDKIFGPFTFKQFIYLAGGAGACFVLWKIFPAIVAIFFIIPIGGLALALTFYRVNGKPFIFVVQAWIGYALQSKLYVWKKEAKKKESPKNEHEEVAGLVPRLSGSKLKDISWSLDVLDLNKDKKS